MKKFQIRTFSYPLRCKPSPDVHKFPKKSLLKNYILPQWPSTALQTLCWCTCATSQKTGTLEPHHVSGGSLTSWLSESKVSFSLQRLGLLVKAKHSSKCHSLHVTLMACLHVLVTPCFCSSAACSKQCFSPLQYTYFRRAMKINWLTSASKWRLQIQPQTRAVCASVDGTFLNV